MMKKLTKHRRLPRIGLIVRTAAAVMITVVMVFPLFWMLSTSLKTESEVMGSTLVFWPSVPQLENFTYVINKVPFFRYMLNTAVVTAMQNVADLRALLEHLLAHLLGERQLLDEIAWRGNRIELTNVHIDGLGHHRIGVKHRIL